VCYYLSCKIVSYVRYAAERLYIVPAGLVEEKVLVWLFNAFESYQQQISICSCHFRRGGGKHTEGPAVNLRIANEDILEDMDQRKRRGGTEEKTWLVVLEAIQTSTMSDSLR
jgi:hypothetical protein